MPSSIEDVFPELRSPHEVWQNGAWTEPFQVFDYARLTPEFLASHLPDARLVDKGLVWTEVNGVQGMLPPAGRLAEVLGSHGFDPRRPALVYDGGNGLWASRLAWALAVAGWNRVVLLEGGLQSWQEAGFATQQGPALPLPLTHVKVHWREEFYATWTEVRDRPPTTIVLDARTRAEYQGSDRRAAKAGRIPGSVWWEWKLALGSDGLSFRDGVGLALEFAALGITAETEVITYCQSGVRAAHALFALRKAGVKKVRNYDGSWEEWGNRNDTPVELD
jgi:thiosulfate/3-mercaptopyruvate sulfurtransferase